MTFDRSWEGIPIGLGRLRWERDLCGIADSGFQIMTRIGSADVLPFGIYFFAIAVLSPFRAPILTLFNQGFAPLPPGYYLSRLRRWLFALSILGVRILERL